MSPPMFQPLPAGLYAFTIIIINAIIEANDGFIENVNF